MKYKSWYVDAAVGKKYIKGNAYIQEPLCHLLLCFNETVMELGAEQRKKSA